MLSCVRERRFLTDEEIIRVLRETDERVLTTPEVADVLDVSNRTALRRLSALADEGRVQRKDINQRRTIWWATDEESETEAPAAPLTRLVGVIDEEAAVHARERSEAWGEAFDDELTPDEA